MVGKKDGLDDGLKAYDPGEFLRPSSTENIAGGAEKHPTPTLRVFTPEGNFWLMYAKVCGGEQDDEGKWFELFYSGLVKRDVADEKTGEVKRRVCFGYFILRVEGDGLETLCEKLGKQVITKLKVGKNDKSEHPYRVDRIGLTTYEPLVLDGADEE